METATLIISVFTLLISLFCLYLVYSMIKKSKDNKENVNTEKKLDDLRESIYNEFSRNRTEQNQTSTQQRTELEGRISDINKTLEKLNTTNQEQLVKILREVSVGLATIREKNSEITEKQNAKIAANTGGTIYGIPRVRKNRTADLPHWSGRHPHPAH